MKKARIAAAVMALLLPAATACTSHLPDGTIDTTNPPAQETEGTVPSDTTAEAVTSPAEAEPDTEDTASMNRMTITQGTGEVYPYDEGIKAYLEAPHGSNVADYLFKTDNQARPITLAWEIVGEVSSLTLAYGLTGCSAEDITEIGLDKQAKSYELYNLYKNSDYTWTLTATFENGETMTQTAAFHTTDLGPRALYIEGVYNTRDAGGYKTADGRVTKQGMIYRGGELPASLSEQAQAFLSETVGVKLEIDLRGYGSESGYRDKSPIQGAELTYAVTDGYMGAFNPGLTGYFAHAFSCMAYEENYPIYAHCTGGADRTGTVMFLLNALLGVPKETLIKDFEFTSFSYYGERNSRADTFYGDLFRQFLARLNSLEGETLADKTETYMLSIGVTQEEINNIRAIMLGDAATVSVEAPERYDLNEGKDYQVILRNVKDLTVTKVIVGSNEPAFTYENGCVTVSKETMSAMPKGETEVKLLLSDGREVSVSLRISVLEKTEIPLSAVVCVNNTVRTDEIRIKVRAHGTVLQIGEQDLSGVSYLEIRYCSDARAMLGDVGSFIALTNTADPIKEPTEHAHVLSQEILANANGLSWEEDIRVIRLDLSEVTYEGMLYLAVYMGDTNGVNINSITFVTE